MTSYQDIIPYTSVFIDAEWRHFFRAAQWSVLSSHDRGKLIADIQALWTNSSNPNSVLPCLSVRTGLDLYLRVMNYPPGTEIIMSAVNIPDMMRVVHAYQLKIVSLDVDLETMAPKLHLLGPLVTPRTKILLVANIFGRRFDMDPVIAAAKLHDLVVIEDCAEGFSGFNYFGHRDSDLSLFSFGPIKYYTAFGGAIAKVRDLKIYEQMLSLYDRDPMQPHTDYLKRVVKYAFVYIFLNCPRIIKPGMYLTRLFNVDHKKYAISMLRGFPDRLMERLRHRPSDALLAMLLLRFREFDAADISMTNMKHEYVTERLPSTVTQVGSKADMRNHWLFPIIVENPDEIVKVLNNLGVDAYRGATQLNVVETDNGNSDHNLSHLSNLEKFVTRYPHEARYLIDHVVYLPVNKTVPFHELDRICVALSIADSSSTSVEDSAPRLRSDSPLKLQSKL